MLANAAGRVVTVVLGVAVVPRYLTALGIEAYGLIGMFAALQALVSLFDFGLGTTLNRQLALDSAIPGRQQHMRDFARTVELVYWSGAVALVAIWLAVAPAIGGRWVHSSAIPTPDVQLAIALMGASAILQLPFTLYGGGLLGLGRQVRYNAVLMSCSILRSVGALVVIHVVGPSIIAFFVWQVLVSVVQSALGAALLWRSIPLGTGERARFDRSQLAAVWRFAAGSAGVAVLGAILAQVDKVLLTRLLPLEKFGYYALAGVLGSSVYLLAQPVYMAYFPRFSRLAGLRDESALAETYEEATQYLVVLLLPAVFVASFFAHDVLLVWTNSSRIAGSAALPATCLVVAYGCVGLQGIVYTLQLALGWTRVGVQVCAAQILLGAPLLAFAAVRAGAVGAASAWIVVNGAGLVVSVVCTHRRMLRGRGWRWALHDVARPAIAALAVTLLAHLLRPANPSRMGLLAVIAATSIAAVAAAVSGAPLPRALVARAARRFAGAHAHAS